MPNDLSFTLSGTPAVVHAQNKKVPGTSSLPYIRIDVKNQLDQNAIGNTAIRLTGNDGTIRIGFTGEDGIVLFENLDYGVTYIASIDKAPFMYTWEGSTLPQTSPLRVTTVSPVAESTLFLSPVQKNDLIIRLEELGDPAIKIQGAQFLITDPDGGTQVVVTGPDGTVDVSLWHGNYSIRQLTTDAAHTIDDTVYNILIQREEELIVENPLINPESIRETVTVTKRWGDPAPDNPNVVIELLGDDLPTGKQQTITSGESTTLTFTDLPKYDENYQRIIYSVKEQEMPGYYAVYEKLDERGYNWSIANYAGELIGECVNGAFWVSTSTSAYEISSDGTPTGRQVVLTSSGTADIQSNTYGYSIALSQDGHYLYTINRRGYLRIFDVSLPVPAEVTTTPIALKTPNGGDIYPSRTDYVHAAEVSDDNTKLFVKSWKSTTIYEYNSAQLLAMASGGTLRVSQGIPSVYTAGDIVYLENGDLLVSGSAQGSLSNTGFWISKKNADGSYAPAVKVGTVSSLNNTKSGAVEGMGMIDGKVVITSTLSDRTTALYTLEPTPSLNNPSSTVYSYSLFSTTTSVLSSFADMTGSSSSTCEAYVKVAGHKTWENDEPADRPQSIQVQFYQNEAAYGAPLTVTAASGWNYVFGDSEAVEEKLPKFDSNGNLYKYPVREIYAPSGYVPVYPNSDQEPNNYNITNKFQASDLYLHKLDENGNALSGVQFALYRDTSGTLLEDGPKFTNADGEITFNNIPLGTYYLKELATVQGYQLDNRFYQVDIMLNEMGIPVTRIHDENGAILENSMAIPFTLTNKRISGDFEFQKKSTTGEFLAGARFQLYQGEILIEEKTTQADGKLVYENLLPGTYQLRELESPAGYKDNNKIYTVVVDNTGRITVNLEGREIASNPLTVYNIPENTGGNLQIKKTINDKGNPNSITAIDGVKFELRYSDEARTDKNGELAGTGSGLERDTTSPDIGVAYTGSHLPFGAGTFLENGIAQFTNIPDDYYYLKEVERPAAPAGTQYTISMAELFIRVDKGETYVWKRDAWVNARTDGEISNTSHSVDVYNPYSGNPLIGHIFKVDGNDPNTKLQAAFEVYQGNTESLAVPYYDLNGQPIRVQTDSTTGETAFHIPNVAGSYWLKEIETPSGYEREEWLIGPMTVTRNEAGVFSVTMANDASSPSLWSVSQIENELDITVNNRKPAFPLSVVKVNDAREVIETGSAVFDFYKEGDYTTVNGVLEITEGAVPVHSLETTGGRVTSEPVFSPGKYAAVERSAPEGYQGLSAPVEIRLEEIEGKPQWYVEPGYEDIAIIRRSEITGIKGALSVVNKRNPHPISIAKVDPSNNIIPTDTATFRFYKNGDYHYEDGKIVITGLTPAAEITVTNGVATSDAVFEPGSYAIVETKPPEGYWGLPEPIEVFLEENGTAATWSVIHGRADQVNISSAGTVSVVNRPAQYPATGGIGSMIFAAGGLAIMGAALLLDRRKRGDEKP